MRSGGASRPSRGCTGSRARQCCPPRARATRSGSLGTLQYIDQVPALPTRQRPALDNAHHVPLVGVVVLVVRVQRARAAHDLLVAPVAAASASSGSARASAASAPVASASALSACGCSGAAADSPAGACAAVCSCSAAVSVPCSSGFSAILLLRGTRAGRRRGGVHG